MFIPTGKATHPWVLLKEELEARWLSQKEFAKIIGKSAAEVSFITSGRRSINIDMAIRIWLALWTSAQVRIGMQNDYDFYKLQSSVTKNRDFKKIRERAKELVI